MMLVTLKHRPQITFAAVALFGSFALIPAAQAQAPAAAAPPPPAAQQSAPIERQPPADGRPDPMRRGMDRSGMAHPGMQRGGGMQGGPNGGRANFHGSAMMHHGFNGGPGSDFKGGSHSGPGGEFRGSEGGGMGAGFRSGPEGMWWKNPMVVQRLTLTPDQVSRMDAIFQKSRIDLIDLKANLEKQEVMLEPMLSANPPDTARASLQIDKVADARASLEKANAKMLLGIRGALTPDQWTKLRTHGGPGTASAPGQPNPPPAADGGAGGGRGRGRSPRGPGTGEDFVAPSPDQP
jgi:Spy/CpxP family protein refolding chaperone